MGKPPRSLPFGTLRGAVHVKTRSVKTRCARGWGRGWGPPHDPLRPGLGPTAESDHLLRSRAGPFGAMAELPVWRRRRGLDTVEGDAASFGT